MGGARFVLILNLNFPKKTIRIVSIPKSNSHLEDISSNVDFGPKRGKLGPKGAQNGWG